MNKRESERDQDWEVHEHGPDTAWLIAAVRLSRQFYFDILKLPPYGEQRFYQHLPDALTAATRLGHTTLVLCSAGTHWRLTLS